MSFTRATDGAWASSDVGNNPAGCKSPAPGEAALIRLRSYLEKHRIFAPEPAAPAAPDLGIVVVIPCYDEPDVVTTLESLNRCARPRGTVEVLVLWNASERDDEALRSRHRDAAAAIARWRAANARDWMNVRILDFPHLPARHAGVGLARKIGMDEAVARFASAGNPRGVIASLDADCVCDENYLVALDTHFRARENARAATIYFEHALAGPLDPTLYAGILRYELFLRYYRHGLRFAGVPFAHYAVGSCLAVRCDAYARHGGMNRRQAGEDFYFLNKLMAAGSVDEIASTRVMPGVRASSRTPFGTGRALRDYRRDGGRILETYDPRIFSELRALADAVEGYFDMAPGDWRDAPPLPDCIGEYLRARDVSGRHREIRANCAGPAAFRKRFFQWFDGLRILKFVHHATAVRYPRIPLEAGSATLLGWLGVGQPAADAASLLNAFREMDRTGLFLTRNKSPLDSQAV